jgi:transcriptional regulator with XRE-family HTH domain
VSKRVLDNAQMVKAIRARAKELGSQKALAEAMGISEGFLTDILKGRAPVPNSVAEYFGFTKRTVYEER